MKFTTVIDQACLLIIHEIFSEIQHFQIWRRCAILKLCAKRFSDRSWKVQFMFTAAEFGIKYDHQSISRKLLNEHFIKLIARKVCINSYCK
jgi:hypothetical protein